MKKLKQRLLGAFAVVALAIGLCTNTAMADPGGGQVTLTQNILINSPPPDVGTIANLDTSPPTASVADNLSLMVTANASPQNQTVAANAQENPSVANGLAITGNSTISADAETITERAALGPESALTVNEIIVSTDQASFNEGRICHGTELATSSLTISVTSSTTG
ncbi:MAG: hypothetical protein UX89_C0013G0009 [Parcubacteria group bacterium GW2011_GWA2_47_16]|nr:MAG: hypothetical protein UX89_C0013G0009 [Parcubacteria group bacterium GW2011_GWA2_47_16]